jgi:hypothetical protein
VPVAAAAAASAEVEAEAVPLAIAPGPAGVAGAATVPSPSQLFGDRHVPRPLPRAGVPGAGVPGTAGAAVVSAHVGGAGAGGAGGSSRLGPDAERVKQAGEHVAQRWILTRGEDNIRDLLPGPILPPVIDKELLVEAEKELGQTLRPYQEAREWLRDAFWERVHRQFGIGVGKS